MNRFIELNSVQSAAVSSIVAKQGFSASLGIRNKAGHRLGFGHNALSFLDGWQAACHLALQMATDSIVGIVHTMLHLILITGRPSLY